MRQRSRLSLWLDRCERLLDSFAARFVLSLLILASLLPFSALQRFGVWPEVLFIPVFGTEFLIRLALVVRRARQRRLQASSLLVLGLDALALISFLPLGAERSWLRPLRLARLFLLLGYWSGLLRELWTVLNQRERRHQILIVLGLGGVLAFGSAAVLLDFGVSYDFDADGQQEEIDDRSFPAVMWWSFLQIEDAGNLVNTVEHHPLILGLSMVLTLAGLLLFSFFIGIGTTVVGELVERARAQPVRLDGHTVILGLTPYTVLLLRGLAEIYRKNLRPYRGAVMAEAATFEDLGTSELRHFQYRQGDPARVEDLELVSVDHAKRVIILGDDSADPDAAVISAILATRQRHPAVPLYPDMEHERNFPAARAAGGPQTHLVGSGSMLGYYVAQNVAYPGIHDLYRHLLQSAGVEIYTYLYSPAEVAMLTAAGDPHIPVAALHRRACQRHRTTLLGFFTSHSDRTEGPFDTEDLEVVLNPVAGRIQGSQTQPAAPLRFSTVRGVIGIAWRFRSLTELAQELLEVVVDGGRIPDSWADRTESSPATPATDLESLVLEPPRREPKRVLIFGASQRVPRVVRELIGFFPGLDITILAEEADDVVPLAHEVLVMLARTFVGPSPGLEEGEEGVCRLHLETPEAKARVTLMAADWTHGHRLEAQGAVTLQAADVVLLLPLRERGTGDSDGRIALDGLHLAHLERTGAVRFRPGTHMLALVRDPAKGELLERRLVAMAGSTGMCRYTVISSERSRHRFIMQNVFVHGLNSVYLTLLDSRGQHFARLLVRNARGGVLQGTFETSALADALLRERGWLLLGFERRAAAGASSQVEVDPEILQPGTRLEWQSISALYVMVDKAPGTNAATL